MCKIRGLFFGALSLLIISGCGSVTLTDESAREVSIQYINLDTATERNSLMISQLGLTGEAYVRIPAVVGRNLTPADLDALVADGVLDKNTRDNNILSAGELGVYLSNLQFALVNAAGNSDKITVTFEDDVVVPYDLVTQFKEALHAVPDNWDMLYLGCYQNYVTAPPEWLAVGPYTPTNLPITEKFVYKLCVTDESQHILNTPWMELDGACVAGLYAYAVNPQSASKLMEKLVPMSMAIDQRIRQLVGSGEIKAYCLNPELVRVNTTFASTIR